MSMKGGFKTIVFPLLLVVCWAGTLAAQLTTGTILGTVKDQSEAVLPGATVKVTNVETGTVRTTVAGNMGEYRFPALAIGSYTVQAEQAGFQNAVRSGITLTIGREAVVNFSLPVGDVNERVTVAGEAPLIDTTSATVSGLIDPQQMRDIPLNARSFIDMATLQTGAVFAVDSGEGDVSKGFGKKLAVVGTRYESNSFLLDGSDVNDSSNSAGSAAGTMAGVETVREFRVITNAYDAQYGRHTGGVISAITKSGTNQFHGSAFEFLRNDNLDAPRWEDNAFAGGEKPEFRRNQFGGSVGGPIIRDRTFFFGSFEGLREGLGQTQTFNVPGVEMRRGILPLSAANCTNAGGQALAGGKCQLTINPAVVPFLAKYPVPHTADRPDGTAQHFEGFSQNTDENFWLARIDHRFSDSDSLFGRFNMDSADRINPAASGFNTSDQNQSRNRFSTLEETHIYSPRLIGKTHFSFNRTHISDKDVGISGFTFPPPASFGGVSDVLGGITVSGLSNWGGSRTNPTDSRQNLFQYKEEFYFSTGRHSLKFGAEGERIQFNTRSDSASGGIFAFTSLSDFLRNNVGDFLFAAAGSDTIRGWRQGLFGLYLQDDIHVRPGFTFNVGLRYEFISVPYEVNKKMANIRDLTQPHLNTFTPATVDLGKPYFLNPSLKNFAPRVGFAWDVFGSGKTALRGGAGVFHQEILPNMYSSAGTRLAPFYSVWDVFARDVPVPIAFPNAFVTQSQLLRSVGAPEGTFLDFTMKQPTVYKWSMDIQQQVAPGATLETGYSGTRGNHLFRGAVNLNTTPAEFRNGRRYILITQPVNNPNWGRFRGRFADGGSDYHALRVSLTKRFSRGFQIQSGYTYSKSTDDSSAWTGSGDWGGDMIGYRTEKIHGLSSFDVRQSFSTNFVYDLPGASLPGAAGKVLGGWGLSSILRFNSGYPLSLVADQPRQGTLQMVYVDGRTLDLIPGGKQNPTRPQNPDQYFDVSQFSYPEPFFQGNLGRGTVTAPGVANIDASLKKDTAIHGLGEAGALQFRAEFFNLFNRPNFAAPAINLFDRTGVRKSSAGQITSTKISSRQIQFALRLIF